MQIVTTVKEMQSLAGALQSQRKRIGFVPTMGFLHDGHLALMRQARQEQDIVVASIFVNPTQFGPGEDLDRYPRDLEGDRAKCASVPIDILFLPEAREMYPAGAVSFVTVDGLSGVLEGAIRPGHFRGVATIVAKLFHIVKPHTAYFGQKDFQQCVVIRRMVRDLDMETAVTVVPTVREPDGLAMSSRNVYLSPAERRSAVSVSQALFAARDLVNAGTREPEKLKQKMRAVLAREQNIAVDYIEVADPETLESLEMVKIPLVILIAIRLGKTRLIDNLLVL